MSTLQVLDDLESRLLLVRFIIFWPNFCEFKFRTSILAPVFVLSEYQHTWLLPEVMLSAICADPGQENHSWVLKVSDGLLLNYIYYYWSCTSLTCPEHQIANQMMHSQCFSTWIAFSFAFRRSSSVHTVFKFGHHYSCLSWTAPHLNLSLSLIPNFFIYRL